MANPIRIRVEETAAPVVISTARVLANVVTAGTQGPRGVQGQKGDKGNKGDSAYQVWLNDGNVGTEQDFLAALVGGNYIHEQMTPQNVWTIAHNLKFFPNVSSFDSAGSQVVGDVEHISFDSLKITFSHPTAGQAYLS